MCKSKRAVDATQPISTGRRTHQSTQPTQNPTATSTAATSSSTSNTLGTSYKLSSTSSTTSSTSSTSLSALKGSLPVPENPVLYDFSELSAATNNFLSRRLPTSSTPAWRCTLRSKNAVVFQRKFRIKLSTSDLKKRLSTLCRSHHTSIIKLLGVCASADHTFLVYEFVDGASLSSCLRNPNNPKFTPLATWQSRLQVATDLAQGLDYIHNSSGLIHNRVKSGAVLVTEPSFHARICHFGSAQLLSETDPVTAGPTPALTRSNSRRNQFEGVRGYMSPEFQATGVASQEADVYAFGVILLEILTGREPLTYRFDQTTGDFIRNSVVETAREAIGRGGGVRSWVDRRLKDSFPVEVAEKLTRVALDCVHVDPDQRPSMERVSGKISKLYLESKFWSDNLRAPTGISVSLGPR